MKKVVVVGSINMDLVTVCERAPKGGETLFGHEFFQVPGGKGANQAVAIGKLGTKITMLGKVGKDSFGKELINSMKANGVDTTHIEEGEKSTGIAKIIVEENGQNRILVVSGANSEVDKEYIDRHLDVIKECDILVTQLEIPIETVEYALKKAKEFGKKTILNPAPARKLDDEIIKNSDLIIPNESELEILTGIETETEDGIKKASEKLLDMGVKNLIVTLGSKGSLHLN
ncbi:ribokinase, partial [Fusobacterium sp.]